MGCARAINPHAYESAPLPRIAAAYVYGIAKAHAFIDGNKRTAFVTAVTFLRLNGIGFRPEPLEGVRIMEDLAAGDVDEAAFAAWLQQGARPL
jgi:death-on-curing protein